MKQLMLICLQVLAASALGQTPSPTATGTPETSPRIWRCELPGGIYEVSVRAIVSVSRHEYVVDAAAKVTEVNIDTQGNMAARFYYVEPVTPKAPSGIGQSALDRASDLAKEAAGRLGQDDAWKRVVKNYPTTTHTHTVEYRVSSEEQLKKIFESAESAFQTGRGGSFKLAD